MPDKLEERPRFAIHLCVLDRVEEWNALIASDRHPWEACTQQGVVHKEPAEAAVAVYEGMNGYKLQMHKERASDRVKILACRKSLQTADEIRDLLRIRRHVAPAAKPDARGAPPS